MGNSTVRLLLAALCVTTVACDLKATGMDPGGGGAPGGMAGSGGAPGGTAGSGGMGGAPGGGGASGTPSSVAITSIARDRPRVGEVVTLSGTGFEVPLDHNLVSIDSTNVDPGTLTGDATHLSFVVPNVASLGPDGGNVTLRLVNDDGFAERGFFLLPALPITTSGNLVVRLVRWEGGAQPLAVKSSAVAVFRVHALTSRAATYTLAAHTDGAGASAVPIDATGAPLALIALDGIHATDPGSEVRVRLTLSAAASGSGTLALALTAQDNAALVGLSGAQPFTVGQPPPAAASIAFAIGAVKPSPARVDADGYHVPAGVTAGLNLAFLLPPDAVAGTYDLIGPSIDGDADHWTAASATGPTYNGGPNGQPQATLTVAASAGALPSRLRFRLQPHGGGPDADVVLPVQLIP